MNVGPGLATRAPPPVVNPHVVPAYSLIVAGATHAGKSSLLRLLLDTAPISPHATQAHLDSLARFVRALQHNSPEPRFTECEVEVLCGSERVLLRLVDSPGLDLAAEDDLERGLRDILSYVEARYVEGARDESTVGESHVHLCLYVLDPANITPRTPPAPSTSSAYPYRRPSPTSSPSSPPSPPLYLPSLPPAEISAIRRLSSRVNVLPVLGRCDTIGLDRLAEIKRAVRIDLAEAGLGFGIFDEGGDKGVAPTAHPKQDPTPDDAAAGADTESVPLLPYALFAPDCYAPHARRMGKRELAAMYAAAVASEDTKREDADALRLDALKGRFVRRYRWGVLDALDVRHADFVALRAAAMEHRKVLKDYTKDYLYEKFKVDSLLAAQTQTPPRILHVHHAPPPPPRLPPPPVSVPAYRLHAHTLPPIVPAHHHPGSVHALLNHAAPREEEREREPFKREREGEEGVGAVEQPTGGVTVNGRKRKITMACNFCRSRKLKCDGIRPACAQCVKRGNTCDYQPHGAGAAATPGQAQWKVKRGAPPEVHHAHNPNPSPSPLPLPHPHPSEVDARIARHDLERRHPVSHAHAHAHAHSAPHPHAYCAPHPHPHVHHHQRDEDIDELAEDASSSAGAEDDAAYPRKRVSVDMLIAETLGDREREREGSAREREGKLGSAYVQGQAQAQTYEPVSVPVPVNGWSAGMGVIDVGSEGDKKKRLNRQSANYGSKAVACVHCRARKTRCDAARPACGNCARRSLACSYVHTQPSQPRSKGKKAAAAAAKEEAARQAQKATVNGDAPASPSPSQQQWSRSNSHSHSRSRSPAPLPTYIPHSPIPTDIVIEESAERDRPRSPPRTRSPAAPPIATLSPAQPAVALNGNGGGGGGGGAKHYTNGAGNGAMKSPASDQGQQALTVDTQTRSRSSSVGLGKRKTPPGGEEGAERPEKRHKWLGEEHVRVEEARA